MDSEVADVAVHLKVHAIRYLLTYITRSVSLKMAPEAKNMQAIQIPIMKSVNNIYDLSKI